MTITLELNQEQEREVRESADRHDEATLRRILTQALETAIERLLQKAPAGLDRDEFEALADQLAASFAASSGDWTLPEEALTREGIYGDHP